MGDHNHHHHDGDSLRSEAARRMTERGEQWTDMRAAVFEALASFDKPASAYDIAEAVSAARGKRVAANSVYRILDLFVGTNLAAGSKAQTLMSPTPTPAASTIASS
jgi:Fur family zinc uptake transcriptional regulator